MQVRNQFQRLHRDGLLDSFDFKSFDACKSCLLGKMAKSSFTHKGERTNDLLGLIHIDVFGPFSASTRGDYSYFITFTDDFSSHGFVYLMRYKFESLEKLKEFNSEVQN